MKRENYQDLKKALMKIHKDFNVKSTFDDIETWVMDNASCRQATWEEYNEDETVLTCCYAIEISQHDSRTRNNTEISIEIDYEMYGDTMHSIGTRFKG